MGSGFFYEMGLRCIERDGLGHIRVLARNVLNMSATTVPWPQVNEASQRGGAASNLVYCLLLPDSHRLRLRLVRRPHPASPRGGGDAAPAGLRVLVAIVFFGDPARSSYDVFGLALLAARVADRFGLEDVGETR